MSSGLDVLIFCGVGRVDGGVTLATHAKQDDQLSEHTDIFTKLLAAAPQKLGPGKRTRLQFKEGSVCCVMDSTGILLYVLISKNMDYPETAMYEMLDAMSDQVEKIAGGSQLDLQTCTKDDFTKADIPGVIEELVKQYGQEGGPKRESNGARFSVAPQKQKPTPAAADQRNNPAQGSTPPPGWATNPSGGKPGAPAGGDASCADRCTSCSVM